MAKIGLVLSGGMVKGAYQVGVLEALSKYISIEQLHTVCASSIGAINAYAYTSHQIQFVKDIWLNIKFKKNYTFVGSLLRKSFLKESIHEMVERGGTPSLKLFVPLLNCQKRILSYVDLSQKEKSNLEQYLNASIALPGFNKPVEVENVKFFDGAMIDNIPIAPFQENDMDYIICVYFDNTNFMFENEALDSKVIKINFTDNASLKSSLYAQNDHIIKMMKEGYDKADSICSILFQKGIDDIDFILKKNKEIQENDTEKHIRLSGDIVVNNMNKVVQKLVKRKIL